MPMKLKSALWALAVLAIALLAAFNVLPTWVAEHATWMLPALAVSVLMLPACAQRNAKRSQA